MKKWKLLSSKALFASRWLSLYENSYLLPNGRQASPYYHLRRDDCVLIVAQTSGGQLVLIRHYRRGIDRLMYEFPAGTVEPGEDVLQTAERELEEETGYRGKALLLGRLAIQPAFMDMYAHVVLVKVEGMGQINRGEDEDMEVALFSPAQITAMIQSGEIFDMGLIAAMQLYRQWMENKRSQQ